MVGQEPLLESRTSFLCRECLHKAAKLADEEHAKEEEDFARLIREASKHPMTDQQRKEQAASFVFGNLALMKEYEHATPAELRELRERCRKAAGLK
jgi:hypothetical protein